MSPDAPLLFFLGLAILTYVRRAWGNEADPVTPANVYEVRGSTMGRTEPWTDETIDDRG